MMQLSVIAFGGAVGAVLRFLLSNSVYAIMGRNFPWGTLFVNVLGSLLMGFLYILFVERMQTSVELRSFVLVGLLGAFTTFSTFSIETLTLIESGELLRAGLNILISIICCVAACWLGFMLGRQI